MNKEELLAEATIRYPQNSCYKGLLYNEMYVSNRQPEAIMADGKVYGIEVGTDYVWLASTNKWAERTDLPVPEIINTFPIY